MVGKSWLIVFCYDERPMQKINCLIVTGIFPPDIGGPASFVPKIATLLVEKDVSCQVITLSDKLDQDQDLPFPVYKILRKQNIISRMLLSIFKIYRLSRLADVIFSNGLYWESAIASYLLQKPLIVKIVGDEVWERATNRGWTNSGITEFKKEKGLLISGLRMMRNFVLRRAVSIIVPSEFTKKMLEGWQVNSSKIHVIYNATEQKKVNKLPAALLEKFKKRTGVVKKYAVMASRLIALKRVDILIKNLKEFPGLGLIVIGDGPEKIHLEALVHQLKLENYVIFTGSVSQAHVSAIFELADFFILYSSTENFPHVILEAMASKLPIIATKVGGIPEIITHGENGILVDPDSPIQLRQGIKTLLEQPEFAQKLAKEGAKSVIRHNWKGVCNNVLSLLSTATSFVETTRTETGK